tara:strand:+ start:864 stop:1076 length:213 start_codon:yes stop_codon:yes gene_type:complete
MDTENSPRASRSTLFGINPVYLLLGVALLVFFVRTRPVTPAVPAVPAGRQGPPELTPGMAAFRNRMLDPV